MRAFDSAIVLLAALGDLDEACVERGKVDLLQSSEHGGVTAAKFFAPVSLPSDGGSDTEGAEIRHHQEKEGDAIRAVEVSTVAEEA
jgi:hypothetical protein